MVESIDIAADGSVTVGILLTVKACTLKDKLTADVTAAASRVAGVTAVSVRLGVMSDAQRGNLQTQLRGDAPGQ